MKMNLHATRMLRALPILCTLSLTPIPAQAEDSPTGKGAADVAVATQSSMAAGAVEDTLQACMARIPKDASIGQRMIAEQSCGRDESERKPFEAIPGARSIHR